MSNENACFYCLSELSEILSCTDQCLAGSGIAATFPTTIILISLLAALVLFSVSIYFRKDIKKLIGLRIGSIAFASVAIFVVALIVNGHGILREIPIVILLFGVGSYVASYLFSFYIIKLSSNTMLFKGKNDMLERLSKKVGVSPPKMYIVFDRYPKAFSVYGIKKAVFLSDSLLEKLDQKEIESVILHELYHIKRKTGLIKSLLKSLSNLNLRIISAPISALEQHEEAEIDKILLDEHGIDTQRIRRKLWNYFS